jgi:CubicO group peptidase (beta-lactamase class C family)
MHKSNLRVKNFRMGPVLIGSCVSFSLFVSIAFAGDLKIEERIHRVENNLIPAVLVKGEVPKTTRLQDEMSRLHVPGVSVAVIHNRKIEWARGFGVTKIDGAPVTNKTLFQAGSISKPLAALVVLRMVEAGKLNLDVDVNQYLKSWKVPASEFTQSQPVTLRHLLTHTGGVTVHGFGGYESGSQIPSLTQILDGEAPANSPPIRVDTPPGSLWRYSGGGYVIVQQLLEDVSNEPFQDLAQDWVFKPAKMNSSSYEQPLAVSKMQNTAMPYRRDGSLVDGGPHIYPERTAAGLWTTPTDLLTYAIEVQRALAGKSNKILSQTMAKEMLTAGTGQYGLGLRIGGDKQHLYFEHSGVDEGYISELIAFENGDGLAVMTSGENGGQINKQVVRTIAYEYGWPDFQPANRVVSKIDPKSFDSLVGSYRLDPDFVLTFTREGNRFISQATEQRQLEIFPENEREFFAKVVDARVTFNVDSDGRAMSMVLHQNGRDHIGQRLSDVEAKDIAEQLASANQRFRDQKP